MLINDLRSQASSADIEEALEAYRDFKSQFFAGMITIEAAYVAGYLKIKEKKEFKDESLEDLV